MAEGRLPFLDERMVQQQRNRARHLAQWHRERGIRPKQNETRMKIVKAKATDGGIVADVELHRTFVYEMKHVAHTEKRVEREQVHFIRTPHRWLVYKAEPLADEADLLQQVPHPSEPYINASIIRSPHRGIRYDRRKVQQYADKWWNGANPKYIRFEVDCTNFVSQCLHAGGAPMQYTGRRERGWWYQGKHGNRELWSYSWAVAQSLTHYLSASRSGLRAERVDSAGQLTIGDVITFDWNGSGRFGHSVIVAAIAADGMPLVNAHTTESYHRYWDYRDSYAWTEKTKYRFFHIRDEF